jgi:periplasmic divalent cation tolerance protein
LPYAHLTDYIQIVFTIDDTEKAKDLVRGLLELKLVACGTIIPNCASIYWWEGKVTEGRENCVVMKTNEKHYLSVEKYLKANHPYTTPEILVLPIVDGNRDYLMWIDESLKGEED